MVNWKTHCHKSRLGVKHGPQWGQVQDIPLSYLAPNANFCKDEEKLVLKLDCQIMLSQHILPKCVNNFNQLKQDIIQLLHTFLEDLSAERATSHSDCSI